MKEVNSKNRRRGSTVLLLLLEKSSGGFVLYLVACGRFVGGRLALTTLFALELVTVSTSSLLALHVRCISRRTVLERKKQGGMI